MKLTVSLPSISLTRGEVPEDGSGPEHAPRRDWSKILRRTFGWGGAGLFFFLLFAWIALPTEAIAWRIGYEARRSGVILDVRDISVRPWGSVTLEEVMWTFDPPRPDTMPGQYFIEELDVSVSLLSLLAGNMDVEVETEREEGTIWARFAKSSDETHVEINVDGLPLYDVPLAAQSLNVPLEGLLNLKADLTAPDHKFAEAGGTISLACSACRAGDGESKLYIPRASKALRDGITIPEIDLGTITGEMSVEDGVAELREPISTESEDLNMSLTGRLQLKDPSRTSRFKMVLKVELTEAFLERSERLAFVYKGAGPKSKLPAPERGLGFKLEGPLFKPKFRGVNAKSKAEMLAERRRQRQARERERAAKRKKPSKPKPEFKPPADDNGRQADEKPQKGVGTDKAPVAAKGNAEAAPAPSQYPQPSPAGAGDSSPETEAEQKEAEENAPAQAEEVEAEVEEAKDQQGQAAEGETDGSAQQPPDAPAAQ